MQVYLPDALYREVKARGLPASELLQEAVVAEVRRQDLVQHADDYLVELLAEVGEPDEIEMQRADAVARRIHERALVARGDDAGARAGRGSAVDALVIAIAEPGSTVLTTYVGDLSALAANAVDIAIEPI